MEGSEDDKGLTEASSASPIHNPHSQSTDSSKEHVYPRQSSLPQKTGQYFLIILSIVLTNQYTSNHNTFSN